MNAPATTRRTFAKCTGRVAAFTVIPALLAAGRDAAPGKPHTRLFLLTENGCTNPRYCEPRYKQAPILTTGGTYTPSPPFASEPDARGPVPFSKGRLTNGDSTFAWKRTPSPYSYWHNRARGNLRFDFRKPYRIRRIRIRFLQHGPHGTESVVLYRDDDPLEFPDVLKVKEVPAGDGWTEFPDLDLTTDRIRLEFRIAPGKQYITLSEVEVWGQPVSGADRPARRRKTIRSGTGKSLRTGDVEWYAFDFGPADSPVFDGFTPVSNSVAYSPERGYGWIPRRNGKPAAESNFGPASRVVPGLHQRDRVGGKAVTCDSLMRDFVMTARCYHTQVRQTFRIDAPDGRYRIRTWHGDIQYGRPGRMPWWIEVDGRRVVDHPVMPRSLRLSCTFDAAARNGCLEITFDAQDPDPAHCGFLLNGLVAIPINTERQRRFADETLRRIDAAIERERDEAFRSVFIERPWVETAKMPPVSEADRARGFVPFVPNWMRNIYPNTVPRPSDLTRTLACFACPGEFEPLSVAVRALRDLTGVRCRVSDLEGPGGKRIPAASVDVRSVRCWPQRLGSSWSVEWRVMPELLEHRESVSIPADRTHQFWLTVHVPDAAAPGKYRGTVAIDTANAGRATIPIEVTVLPFSLAEPERVVGMYWRDDVPANVRRKQIADMVAHGVTAVAIGYTFPELSERDGKLVLDVTKLTDLLRDLRRMGIRGPVPYQISGLAARIRRLCPGRTPEQYDDFYVEAIRQLQAVSDRPDTPQLLFYPVDEIGNSEERGRKAHHECALIHKVPGAVSYITVNNYAAGEKWGDTFDIWCGNIVYTRDQEQRLLARGKRYMRYGPAYLNDPRKARSSSGFGFYLRPAEAMYYWHYQYPTGDPFTDFDGRARDWCAAYPGPDGTPIPTTDWEGIREGIDDLRYIATLKKLAGKAAARPETAEDAKHAIEVLENVLDDDSLVQTEFRKDLDDDAYHALRRRLADAIIALLKR